MPTYRIRAVTDTVIRAPKPLSTPHLVMIANRCGTYMRTAAFEGLESKVEVLYGDQYKNSHAHHHDARETRCRPDYNAAVDALGPVEGS